MPSINCEVTLDLNWPKNCVICEANRAPTFAMTSTKRNLPVVTLSTQDNAKLLQQIKSVFKTKMNLEQISITNVKRSPNQYLDFCKIKIKATTY